MSNSEIKKIAKENLKSQMGTMILIPLIMSLITGTLSATGIGSIGILIIMGPLTVGVFYAFYKNSIKETVEIKDMFLPFQMCFGESFLMQLLVFLYTFLWSLLFVIPGIIKYLSYSMAPYIMARDPDVKASESINISKEMMNGHKMDLFFLYLSFIGWYLLSVFTLGILLIWVIPYQYAAVTEFYNQIYKISFPEYINSEEKVAYV